MTSDMMVVMLGHPLPSRAAARPVARLLAAGGALVLALPLLPAAPLLSAALADPALAEGEPPAHAYAARGAEVSGGASQAQAASVEPGLHRDSFAHGGAEAGEDGTVKYYRVAVADGQRVHAAATIAAPPVEGGLPEEAAGLGVDVSFLTAAGDACDDGSAQEVGESRTGDGPVTAAAVSDVIGPDGCAGDELFVRVAREGPKDRESPLPLELQVALQPAGIGGGAPAVDEPIEDEGARPVSPEDPEPIAPGRSIGDALEVGPGSHVLELVPGETALLRLELREGQRLRWRTEVVAGEGSPSGSLALRVLDAVRSPVEVGGGSWDVTGAGQVRGGGMAAPVDLGNRGADRDAISSAWLPGTHTVQVQRLQRPADADPEGDVPMRIVLTLEVEGEPAEDAAEGTVLELGDARASGGWHLLDGGEETARALRLAGAGALAVAGLGLGAAGVLVLRPRRG
jgi:hypothetical protein